MHNDMNHPDSPSLSRADGELIDRLLAGETLDKLVDSEQPGRAEHISRLLSLLDQWEAGQSETGLTGRTLSTVLGSNPVTLSVEDSEALDALLQLRRLGMTQGPMPTGVRERSVKVQHVLSLLDRANDEPVPQGLVAKTLQTIERDRQAQQQRSALSAMATTTDRQGAISIRQIATTAALLVMALSILLPMLNNAKHHAQVAQCSENLAGLGSDLQQLAFDNKGQTHRPTTTQANALNPLAKLAQTNLDGSAVPANRASIFVFIDEQRVASKHLACPTRDRNDPTALYNGQNPAAGGPFRAFLKPRPIFADTNPLYTVTPKGLVRNQDIPSLTPSANHNARGQNTLISDGSVNWMIRPTLQRHADTSDNIWLYQQNPNADQADDIFLTP